MRCFAAVALAALILAATATAQIKPGRGMSRVELGMTAAQVQGKLGRPVGKGGWKWYYPRVTVTFRNRRVVELMTTRSTERFANGLGVDSSEAEVRRAFPRVQCAPMPPFFRRCRLGTGAPKSRVTDFIIGTTRRVIYVIITQLP
ncbi:MAG: outer membrane protein assembly factor BamE [Actinomycetota bacterium]|nr:outer membrane protein assembly factor BamE [Actinomycetota bacterium]